ncbi:MULTISPECIES: hypothetical protein [unclassified Microbulbifer]|uniref:hypothetical protein n=1 Tax=unclassified Microbulbifer TaxID=2619833 RepID=UPI0027E3C010|nr:MULTISPECIES: hypothetical protein [unclassified Microbulbifer]
MILVLSITTVLILFRFHIFMTVLPFECWSFEDVWDHRPEHFNPFWAYTTVFLLLTAWSIIELVIGVAAKSVRVVPLVSLLLMTSVLFGHMHFWQSFKIMRGEQKFSYFTVKLINFRLPQPEERLPGSPPSWQEYLIENRCSKGLAISNMSKREREELRKKYLALWR